MKKVHGSFRTAAAPSTISTEDLHRAAASAVLQQESRPMTAADIYKAAIHQGLLSTSATTEAQVTSLLCSDVKHASTVFISISGGCFGLKSWATKQVTKPEVKPALHAPLQAASTEENIIVQNLRSGLQGQLSRGVVQQQQHSQLEELEPLISAQHQHHRAVASSQPQQLQICPQEALTDNLMPSDAYRQSADASFVAQDSGSARVRKRSSSGMLLSPNEHHSSRLLGLPELTSPTPCAAKLYISNDGTTIAAGNQQNRRLSLLIPMGQGGAAVAAPVSGGHTSPVGTMVASLLAETAGAAHSVVNTPWGMQPPALATLLSPGTGAQQDAACSSLATPNASGPGPTSTRRTPVELNIQERQQKAQTQELVGDLAGQSQGDTRKQTGRKRPVDAILLDPRCAEVCNAAQAAAVAALGGSGNGESELVALVQWQQTIEAAEQQWGPSHPAVGRAWLELARVWQATDKENDRAKYATKKAFDICQILLQQTAMESRAQQSYQYLLDKFNRKSYAAKRAQQAAATAANESARAVYEASSAMAAATPVTLPGLMAVPAPGLHTAPQQQYQQQYPAVTLMPGVYMHPDAGAIYAQWGLPQGLPVAFTTQSQPDMAGLAMQQAAAAVRTVHAKLPAEDIAVTQGQGDALPGAEVAARAPQASIPVAAVNDATAAATPASCAAAGGAGTGQVEDGVCRSTSGAIVDG